MTHKYLQIAGQKTLYAFDEKLSNLGSVAPKANTIILTDENVQQAHGTKWKGYKAIVVPAGEPHKQQSTIDGVIARLMDYGADRTTTLVGIGGGVVTDMAGYAASVYMRGIRVGLVPTSILAMVDAAIGGKNGVDVGPYKNLVGTIRQPDFLWFDTATLKTLPQQEWQNGFAEIIKHSAIKDAAMFKELEQRTVPYWQRSKQALQWLIKRNALLKTKVVQADPTEKGDRKLLNFGHTIGHAIENDLNLPHGYAIAIGMVLACSLSAQHTGFKQTLKLVNLLEQYGLPTHAQWQAEQVMHRLQHDKKRVRSDVHFVLLEKIGKAVVKPIPVAQIQQFLQSVSAT